MSGDKIDTDHPGAGEAETAAAEQAAAEQAAAEQAAAEQAAAEKAAAAAAEKAAAEKAAAEKAAVEDATDDIYMAACQRDGYALQYVPEELKTIDLCMVACK